MYTKKYVIRAHITQSYNDAILSVSFSCGEACSSHESQDIIPVWRVAKTLRLPCTIALATQTLTFWSIYSYSNWRLHLVELSQLLTLTFTYFLLVEELFRAQALSRNWNYTHRKTIISDHRKVQTCVLFCTYFNGLWVHSLYINIHANYSAWETEQLNP